MKRFPQSQYTQGEWVAITGARGWLVVDVDPWDALVSECFGHLSSDGGGDDVLAAFVTARGAREVPPFAFVSKEGDDQLRVIVRHPARVALRDHSETRFIEAHVGSTWVDLIVPAPDTSVTLEATPAAGPALPLTAGVTRAGAIVLQYADPAAGAAKAPVSAPVAPAPAPALAPAPAPVSEPAAAAVGTYDHLFGATEDRAAVLARLQAEALREAAPEAVPSGSTAAPSPLDPNATLAPRPDIADPPADPGAPAAAGRASAGQPAGAGTAEVTDDVVNPPANPPAAAQTVLAAHCPQGHLSAAYAPLCRACGQAMPANAVPFEVPRPVLGTLTLTNGDVVTLDRGVVLGRAPHAPDDLTERPHLVRLTSLGLDVSRMHAEVVLDGWHVLLRDLGSSNGTTLTQPGRAKERLAPHDLHRLQSGSVIGIADVLDIRFEETS